MATVKFRWTPAEDALLLAAAKVGPVKALPNRTLIACRIRTRLLGAYRREIVRTQTTADASAWNRFLGVKEGVCASR